MPNNNQPPPLLYRVEHGCYSLTLHALPGRNVFNRMSAIQVLQQRWPTFAKFCSRDAKRGCIVILGGTRIGRNSANVFKGVSNLFEPSCL
jgi:hypothetical protein